MNMEFERYTFFSDPGHGWLQVPVANLKQLGIAADISQYSYQRNGNAYLEEDCDLPRFVIAYKARFGKQPSIVDADQCDYDSPIRGYRSYEVQS